MNKNTLRLSVLVSALGLLVFLPPVAAYAFWPFGWLVSDQSEDFTPPAEDTMEKECDPIRLKIVKLNQKNKVIHPFYRPRIGLLKRKYNKCTQKFRDQEYKYLKHAQIQRPQPLTPPDASSPNLTPLDDPRLKKNAERGLDPALFAGPPLTKKGK